MFVKPLALLFFNVFACLVFSYIVGPSHKSAVKGRKEAKSSCLCDRAHKLTIEHID
jgi:hypothetical protein